MKLKVKRLFEATPVIAAIFNENRPLPGKGKYRVSRLAAKLAPEYNLLRQRRLEMIKVYDVNPPVLGPDGQPRLDDEGNPVLDMDSWTVPDEHMPEFTKQWEDICAEEIEIEVEPVPIDQLCLDGAEGVITPFEFDQLGELVRE